ncbi:MAG: exodeoxyribonuclease VII small subunit [Gemmatimonadales bacterium]
MSGQPDAPSLSDELRRLEEIVRRLEADDLDLDGALALFEEGIARLRTARGLLQAAELKVKQVLAAGEDGVGLRDLKD